MENNTEMMSKCSEKMQECMKRCRWCPLIPMILGTFFLLVGYYLDAKTVRVLWMVFSGLITLLGVFCFIMMSVIKGPSGEPEEKTKTQ